MAVVSGDSDGVVVGILGYSALEAERKRARSQNNWKRRVSIENDGRDVNLEGACDDE